MNRRDLLKYAGAAGAVSMLSSPLTRLAAAPRAIGKPRRLLMVLAQGGWDTTYALDPKAQSAVCDIPAGAIRRFGNLDVFTDASRPNVTAFFTKYAANTAVVRGISVASVAHQECVKRMATGTRSEVNPDMGAIVAHDNGNDLPLPYLILGDTAFAGEYAVSAGRVGATNQIIALLDPAQAYPSNGRPQLATTNAEDALLARYANATANRLRATRGSKGYNRRRVEDFESSIKRGKQLQGVRDGFGARGRTLTIDSQVDLALDALGRDISQAVMLNTRLPWDTHDTNTDQAGFHETTFGGLTRLLDGLAARPGRDAGTTMLDDTVVVCFSEFSRTPKLNANLGKDHWPVTSAMVMGAGVRGGYGYGATTAGVEARTIDFATGAPSATGKTLMSNHFVGGVLQLCGVDAVSHLGATEVFDAFVA
ncbi:MAG: DUF1501 domain-containing protein [Deltaproteobacteria bacterium]|nr:DUF1501 domain-containing protein [Deltaproteobacteria bacterium]MDQ3301159.1 DUF1501 domain-containing protein [Myxococcota bacterium]